MFSCICFTYAVVKLRIRNNISLKFMSSRDYFLLRIFLDKHQSSLHKGKRLFINTDEADGNLRLRVEHWLYKGSCCYVLHKMLPFCFAEQFFPCALFTNQSLGLISSPCYSSVLAEKQVSWHRFQPYVFRVSLPPWELHIQWILYLRRNTVFVTCLFSTSYTYHNIEVLPNAVTVPSNCVKSNDSNWNFPHSQRDNGEVGWCCRVPLGHQRQPHRLLVRLCGAQPFHCLHRHCNLQGQGNAWHQTLCIPAPEKFSTSTKSTWEWEMRNMYNRRLALLKTEIAAQTFCKAESVFFSLLPWIYYSPFIKWEYFFHQEVIKCWHSLFKECVESLSFQVLHLWLDKALNNLL